MQHYYAGFAQAWKVLDYTGLSWKVLENIFALKSTLRHSKALKSPWILPLTGGFNSVFGDLNQYEIVVTCLCLVQHMLHQVKAPQFYTNYLKLISLVMDPSISEVEFNVLISIFLKFSVLENSRKVFEKSLKSPWILHNLACMNPVMDIIM